MSYKLRGGMARAAVTAGLAIAMAAGPVLPTLAYAAPEQGKVTIAAQEGNAVTYEARKVFSADLGADGKAQHIEWASAAAKDEVEALILETDADYDGTTAQDALEFVNANWGASSATRIVGADDFANKLAQAARGLPSAADVTPGTAATLDEGFYLLTAKDAGLAATHTMGTSAIWVAVNKDVPTNVTEKTSLPSITKEVKEDSTGEWGKTADAQRGQEIEYRLTGTVASNVATFGSYFYKFTDSMTGLAADEDSVAVTVDGVDVTDQATIGFSGGKLIVEVDDLKALVDDQDEAIPITAATQVVVTYKASLTSEAAIGATGNPNTAYLEYSNNPYAAGHGKTSEVQAKAHAYQLELVKVDKDDATEKLSGAKITIQVAQTSSDAASRGKYVQADGTLGTTAHEFTTGANGSIAVSGLDEGTYVLHEVTPPSGYDAWDADITLTITSTFNAITGAFETIAATMSGGEGDANTKVVAADAATGKVSIQATDDKEIDMPLTGGAGVALITAAGMGIIGVSLAGLWKTRERDDEGKQS